MKIFVYEYTSARADASPSLRREGQAMLRAIIQDLQQIEDVEPFTLLASPCSELTCPCFPVHSDEQFAFQQCVKEAELSLIIAPETDLLLLERARWVETLNGKLAGCASEIINLTGDKLAFAEHLHQHDIPTPKTSPASSAERHTFPLVAKLRIGAGSENMHLIPDEAALRDYLDAQDPERMILQQFHPGEPVSVAVLAGPEKKLILAPAAQHLTLEGRFEYLGGQLPLSPARATRARRLAERVLESLPLLRGYVGIDMLLGDAADGSQDLLIELNPRLTTSYVGLQALSRTNLAEVMVNLLLGKPTPPLDWLERLVTFTAAGEINIVKPR